MFIEPVKANFAKLSRIMANKSENIKLFNLAVGNFNGVSSMFTEEEHQGKSCSLLKPKLHLEQYPDIIFNSQEEVEVRRLDDIEYDRTLYDHLHIDTQGYEMEVLQGAKKSLRLFATVAIEVYREELYEGCAMHTEVTAFMRENKFHLMNIFWRGNSWGDAEYLRLCE
ncbi:MAG: FkbM family methyltransferase [Thermodesulfobacteriales bacterium]|nr:MAG: FkbM family methyltransferase [Thermodesulfobacteriales bacterium]